MVIEYIFYAALGGAGVFAAAYFLTKKDKGLAWLVTIGVAALAVVFVFPGPQQASNLGHIAGNIILLIHKGLYLIGWGAGAFAVSWLWP
jgi:hypothetical protein